MAQVFIIYHISQREVPLNAPKGTYDNIPYFMHSKNLCMHIILPYPLPLKEPENFKKRSKPFSQVTLVGKNQGLQSKLCTRITCFLKNKDSLQKF